MVIITIYFFYKIETGIRYTAKLIRRELFMIFEGRKIRYMFLTVFRVKNKKKWR